MSSQGDFSGSDFWKSGSKNYGQLGNPGVRDVSPDRDIDLMRRFEALKGGVAKGYAERSVPQQTAGAESHFSAGDIQDLDVQKLPLTLADIQGCIGKRHNKDLANAQKKWIDSLNSQGPGTRDVSELEAQREWVSKMQFAKFTPEKSSRNDDRRRRSEAGSSTSERSRYSHQPASSSPVSSPHKVPRPLTVKSTVLAPAAPSFGFCNAPRIALNSLPVTITTVTDVLKPDKEFVTETGKTIKVVKLEEPPKYEKKVKGPQKMRAVIDIDPSKNEDRHKKSALPDARRSSCRQTTSLPAEQSPESSNRHHSPGNAEKHKCVLRRKNDLHPAVVNQGVGEKSRRNRSDDKSPKKIKRTLSLPSGLNEKSESTCKPARNYDVNEARNFIKQKQKEREERLAEEKRKKEIEEEEQKKKMQQLRDTQRRIMQKIKKRTVHKIRRQSTVEKEQEKPNWVGPMENPPTSVLDSSFEIVPPRPKSANFSTLATGTITIKKKQPNPPPIQVPRDDDVFKKPIPVDKQMPKQPEPPCADGLDVRFDAKLSCSPAKAQRSDRDLELANDSQLALKRRAPDLAESTSQIEMDEDQKPDAHESKSREATSSKRSKPSISEPAPVESKGRANKGQNSSRYDGYSAFDRFLAEYVPTPEKKPKPRQQTPDWLQEMSQLPDQFNLINTLERALQLNSSTAAQPVDSAKNMDIQHKKDRGGFPTAKTDSPSKMKNTSSPLEENGGNSNSSSRLSELALEAPQLRLDDTSFSLSTAASTSVQSFGKYQPAVRPEDVSWVEVSSYGKNLSDLDVLFPDSEDAAPPAKPAPKQLKILGEVLEDPQGVVTLRKPLRHKFAEAGSRGNDLPPDLQGKSLDLASKPDCNLDVSSSEICRSLSASSFSSIKEGSYVVSRSETVDGGSSYRRFVKPFRGRQGDRSDHSSDSISEIVKVSRTLSRGSTVFSEEVSEMQNTLSVSTKTLKFNSSVLQNKIKNEIKKLDRVNESLDTFIESGKNAARTRDQFANLSQCEPSGPSNEPTSTDLVTVRRKSPLPLDDNLDTALVAAPPRMSIHSREPSASSLDVSMSSGNGVDVSKFTVDMFDTLIRDEKLRSEQHVTNLKMRMKNLCGRTRKDVELIESQRKELIETGHDEEAKDLKRKQRGHIMKMDEEYAELKKLEAMEHRACQERCILLKQQQQIIRSLLQTQRDPTVRSSRGSLRSSLMSQMDETVRYIGNDRGSDIIDRKKREFREREESLRERKKNIEALIAWKKRIEQEEKIVREKEKLIAQSSFSAQLPESVVERGTSPVPEMKETSEEPIKPSTTEIQAMPATVTSQSESELQPKDYYSDSFEHSSVASETMVGSTASALLQGSPFFTKAMRMPMIKTPLSPRVTIVKRRHSSGSDESMLLSQNDTLSEPSDVDVRVSALEQQLRHRKSELAKLKREYQKNQKERLRSTERNLINQIQLYDSYIEQVKTEIKELENSDVRVTKPQIKQPKFAERRQSDRFPAAVKPKERQSSDSAKRNETASEDSLASFLDKGPTCGGNLDVEGKISCAVGQRYKVDDPLVKKGDFDVASEKIDDVKTEVAKDSESSTSEKDFSIEEIVEKAEQSRRLSDDLNSETVVESAVSAGQNEEMRTVATVSEISEIRDDASLKIEEISSAVEDVKSRTEIDFVSEELDTNVEVKTVSEDIAVSEEAESEKASISNETVEQPLEIGKNVSDRRKNQTSVEMASVSEKLSEFEAQTLDVSSEKMTASPGTMIFGSASPISFSKDILEVKSAEELVSGDQVSGSVKTADVVSEEDVTEKGSSQSETVVEEEVESGQSPKSKSSSSKSARKRLDMEDASAVAQSVSAYEPTMKMECGVRTISELISMENSSIGSAVSEAVAEESAEVEEAAEEVEEVEEESTKDREAAGDSELEKLDFGLDDILGGSKEESGDHGEPNAKNAEVFDRRTEIGQGDEPARNVDMEADSLEGPFDDFNATFDPDDLADSLDRPKSKTKPMTDEDVKEMLQDSFELSDKIWESKLAQIEKSPADTPLLTALQRERQQNFNVESISNLIYDSFIDDATSTALSAYRKKLLSPQGKGVNSENEGIVDSDSLKNVGDNDKLWLGDDFTLQASHEAEQLRLQQLQIEQEIEQLEQAQEVVPYYYVREIPNKPPPPYTPPKPSPPTMEETVSRVLRGGEILWDVDAGGGDPSEATMPPDFLPSLQDDEPYRLFLFDLSKELYLKLKPRPPAPTPPWIVRQRRGKPLPPIRCKEDLLKYMEKEVKIVFGYEPRIIRETLIMKWTRKKRDHVDEILVRELQESESEWRDFTVEENIIKNRIADSLIADMFDDAVAGLADAFKKKFDERS